MKSVFFRGLCALLSVFILFSTLSMLSLAAGEQALKDPKEGKLLFKEDFASSKVGDFSNDKFALYVDGENGTAQMAKDDNGNLYAVLTDNTDKAVGFSFKIPATNIVSVVADICTLGEDGSIGLWTSLGSGFPYANSLAISPAGVYMWDADKISLTSFKPEKSKWYRAVFIHNATLGTSDCYIDGKLVGQGYANRTLADGKKFAGPVDYVSLTTGSTKAKEAKFYVDNIKVFEGGPDADSFKPSTNVAQAPPPTAAPAPTAAPKPKVDLRGKTAGNVTLLLDSHKAYINNSVQLIDPKNLSVKPFTVDGRTLVPLRFLAENLGATVSWEDATATATVASGTTKIEIKENEKFLMVGGQKKEIDVPAMIKSGRFLLPLRAVAEALGKKVFWDDRGLIMMGDTVIAKADEDVILSLLDILTMQKEVNSFAPYSNTYASSRWFYATGADPRIYSTMDFLKRFAATDQVWSYIPKAQDIASITSGGVRYQGALNMNLGWVHGEKTMVGQALNIEGNPINPSFMIWGSLFGCVNHPDYFNVFVNEGKKYIDGGASALQCDSIEGNTSLPYNGGCFCEYCTKGFRAFLNAKYSKEELAKLGVDNIDTFDYKLYMKEKFGTTTVAQFYTTRMKSLLYKDVTEYEQKSTKAFHQNARKAFDEYAGRSISYSGNVPFFGNALVTNEFHFVEDVLDFAMGEHQEYAFTINKLVTNGPIMSGFGKSHVVSPVPHAGNVSVVRQGLPLTYALGHYFLVPWDNWVEGNYRYFGKAEDYADLYHFIREYKELFDGYEIMPKNALLVDWNLFNSDESAKLEKISMNLFEKGVPFIDTSFTYGKMTFPFLAEKLKGVDNLISFSPMDGLKEADKQAIKDSGVKVVGVDSLEEIAKTYSAYSFSERNVFGILRSRPFEADTGSKVLHVLNRNDFDLSNVGVTISDRYFYDKDKINAILYRPGKDPMPISFEKSENGTHKATIDNLGIWGIILFDDEALDAKNGYTTYGIGNPSASYNADFSQGITLSSAAKGINHVVPGDEGTQDQIAFAYKNIQNAIVKNGSITAKITALSGDGGVMMRENIASNAPFAAVYLSAGKLKLASRAEFNKPVEFKELGAASVGNYIKLEKTGVTYKAYVSADGSSFGTPLGQANVIMSVRQTAGVFSSNGEASFDEVRMDVKDGDSSIIKAFSFKKEQYSIAVNRPLLLTPYVTVDKMQIPLHDMVQYSSSDPSIISVDDKGMVTGLKEGKAVITASIKVTGQEFTTTATFDVTAVLFLYREDFESSDSLPKAYTSNNKAIKILKENGSNTLAISSDKTGETADINFSYAHPGGNTTYEFDFKATFGSLSETTGARVLYIDGFAISITADKKGFYYFFGDKQEKVADLVEGKWFKIKLEANYEDSTCDVYIDDKQVVDNGIFRAKGDPRGMLQLGGWRVGTDSLYQWDNIKIYTKD